VNRQLVILVLLLAGLTAGSALCDIGGIISGRVVDYETGQPVVDATVRLIDLEIATATDSLGQFALRAVPPGDYTINITRIGYHPVERRIRVGADDSAKVLVRLRSALLEVEGTTVTASRFEQESFEAPVNVSITPKTQFSERNFSTTAEALREEAGILIQKTTYGHGAPIIRGLIGRYVLLLYDGIRLNKPTFRLGGNQYLNTIDLETLDRIEIVRGPTSVLYGSDAIGGTVNMIPETPLFQGQEFKPRIGLVSRYATADDGKSVHLRLAGGSNRIGAEYGVTYKDIGNLEAGSDIGTQLPTGWDELNHSVRIAGRIDGRNLVRLDYAAVRQNEVPRFDRYASGEFEQYVYDPQNRDLAVLSFESQKPLPVIHALRVAVTYQYELEGRIEQLSGSPRVFRSEDKLRSWGGYLQLMTLLGQRHEFTYGAEYYHDKVNSVRTVDSAGIVGIVRPTYPDNSRYNSAGIFVQNRLLLARRLYVTLGARLSVITTDAKLEAPFNDFDQRFSNMTGALSLSYRPRDNINVIASWASGFRAPNFNDAVVLKFSSSGVDAPSPDLQAENSDNFELGIKADFSQYSGSLFLFYNRLSDLIDRRPGTYEGLSFFDENGNGLKDAGEPDIYQRANVGNAYILGFEYESTLLFRPRWEWRLVASWTRGENETDDEPLSRIPPLMGTAGVRHYLSAFSWVELFSRMSADQRRLSQRDIDDTRIEPNGTDGWITLNLRGRYEWERFSVNAMFENIFDVAYKVHGSGIYSPGRNLIVSLVYSFGE
jgi:hemoglobin/transferrin/lactoferrin receptor protein